MALYFKNISGVELSQTDTGFGDGWGINELRDLTLTHKLEDLYNHNQLLRLVSDDDVILSHDSEGNTLFTKTDTLRFITTASIGEVDGMLIAAGALTQPITEKDAANGYAGLDGSGLIANNKIGVGLGEVIDNGAFAVTNNPIDITTAATMTVASTGAMTIQGSSMALTSVGSMTTGFFENVSSASVANGAQITHGKTLKVTSNTSNYDGELESNSFVTKAWIESAIALAQTSAGAGGKLGDIIASGLTAAQMATQSTDWKLCDGSSCTGTALETLTGGTNVPDLRGQFLRGLDTAGTVDTDGVGRTLLDTQLDENKSHNHTSSLQMKRRATVGTFYGEPAAAHNGGGVWTGYQVSVSNTGGDEARPRNVSVNYFIKVN